MADQEIKDVRDHVVSLGKQIGKGIDKVAHMDVGPAKEDVANAVGAGLKNSARFLNKLLGRSNDPKFETNKHDLGDGKSSYHSSTATSEQFEKIKKDLPEGVTLVPNNKSKPPTLTLMYKDEVLSEINFKSKERNQYDASENQKNLTELAKRLPAVKEKIAYMEAYRTASSNLAKDKVVIPKDSEGHHTFVRNGASLRLSEGDTKTLNSVVVPTGPITSDNFEAAAEGYKGATKILRDDQFLGRVVAIANTPKPVSAANQEPTVQPSLVKPIVIKGVGEINTTVENASAITAFVDRVKSNELSAGSPEITPTEKKDGIVLKYKDLKGESFTHVLTAAEAANPKNEKRVEVLENLAKIAVSKVVADRLQLARDAEGVFNGFKADFPSKTGGVIVDVNKTTGALTFMLGGVSIFPPGKGPSLSVPPTPVDENTNPKPFVEASNKLKDPNFHDEVRKQVAANASAKAEGDRLLAAQQAEARFKTAQENFPSKTGGVLVERNDQTGVITFTLTKGGASIFPPDKGPEFKLPPAGTAQTNVSSFDGVTAILNDPNFHEQVKRQVAANASAKAEGDKLLAAQQAEARFKTAQDNFPSKTGGVLVERNDKTGVITFTLTKGGPSIFPPDLDPKLTVPTAKVDANTEVGKFTLASMNLESPSFQEKVRKQVEANSKAAEQEAAAKNQVAAVRTALKLPATYTGSLGSKVEHTPLVDFLKANFGKADGVTVKLLPGSKTNLLVEVVGDESKRGTLIDDKQLSGEMATAHVEKVLGTIRSYQSQLSEKKARELRLAIEAEKAEFKNVMGELETGVVAKGYTFRKANDGRVFYAQDGAELEIPLKAKTAALLKVEVKTFLDSLPNQEVPAAAQVTEKQVEDLLSSTFAAAKVGFRVDKTNNKYYYDADGQETEVPLKNGTPAERLKAAKEFLDKLK